MAKTIFTWVTLRFFIDGDQDTSGTLNTFGVAQCVHRCGGAAGVTGVVGLLCGTHYALLQYLQYQRSGDM